MSGTTGAQPWQLPDLTVPQMRGMLAFLHGWDGEAFNTALEAVRRTPADALPGQAAPPGSESWTCGGCHGTFTGHQPIDSDRCPGCQPAVNADGYLTPLPGDPPHWRSYPSGGMCGAQDDSYGCSAVPHDGGNHVAYDGRGRVCHRWPATVPAGGAS